MTIDEAIKHCLEVADEQSRLYSLCPCPCDGTDNCMSLENGKDMGCIKCAADNRQLAEWLTELKELRGLVAASRVLAKDVLAVDTLCKQILEYKRLLKLAVEDIESTDNCCLCKYYDNPAESCQTTDDCFVWRYADEAQNLIGGSENG
jgi:hypothetical protein